MLHSSMNTLLIKSLIAAAALVPFIASAAETSVPAETAPSAPAASAQEKLPYDTDGTWKPIAAVMGGVRLPKEAVDAITLRVYGENYEVIVAGEKEPDKGTCV